MGFFAAAKKTAKNVGMPSIELLHRLECKACPLNTLKGPHNAHMLPHGAKKPLIYALGAAPSVEDDKKGVPFKGESGALARRLIPDDMRDQVRWGNVVRTRTPGGRLPEKIEIEACRPSVEKDIAATKPKAIFGFGDVPLQWVIGQWGVRKKWRGRHFPVKIGGHTAWYFPLMHPTDLLKMRSEGYRGNVRISEFERATQFDVRRALRALKELPAPRVMTAEEAESDVEIIPATDAGLARLDKLLKAAGKEKFAGVDYETFRVRPYAADALILTAAVSTSAGTFAFPMDHPQAKWTKQQRARIDELWREFLLSPCLKAVHNLSFEMEWSAVFYGTEVLRASVWGDSYNQAAVLDERFGDTKPGCLSLEFLVLLYFGFNLKSLSPLDKKDLRKEPLADVLRYNGMDAKFHLAVFLKQRALLKAEGLSKVYREDVRKIPTVVLSQVKGVPVDQSINAELAGKYEKRVSKALKKIMALPECAKFKRKFGREFNPASNKDMPLMLLDILGFKEGQKFDDKTGDESYGTDEAVLSQIDHPLARLELKRRKASKRLSTYILPYGTGSDVLWPDGLIHPIFKQPGTMSNRTAAEDPNVQNMNKRDPEAKEIRRQLRAPDGHLWVSFDYGQIQFRGVAMLTRDAKLIKYLRTGQDVHADWTNRIAHAYPDRVGGKEFLNDWGKDGAMKMFRGDIKNQWTFPAIFGASAKSRAEYLKVPFGSKFESLDADFWREFSGIKEWHERLLSDYRKYGTVEHIDGRLNRAPLSMNQVFNLPVQGIEAQIVMNAFCRLSERAEREGDFYFQPELEIHDDLSFILPVEGLDYYVREITTEMLNCPFDFVNVPLEVECLIGKDLYKMEEILKASSDTWMKKAA